MRNRHGTTPHGSRKPQDAACHERAATAPGNLRLLPATGLAESTFGRRAVNDGKLTARLRNGGRITTDTLDRIHDFMAAHPPQGPRPIVIERSARAATHHRNSCRADASARRATARRRRARSGEPDPQRNFRFFDNRQKYLLFVNTCSEKWEVAHRVSERTCASASAPAGGARVRRRRRRRLAC